MNISVLRGFTCFFDVAGNVRVLKCFSSANGWRGGLVDAMFSDFRELVFVAGFFCLIFGRNLTCFLWCFFVAEFWCFL